MTTEKNCDRRCDCCHQVHTTQDRPTCGYCLAYMRHDCSGCLSARMNRSGRA